MNQPSPSGVRRGDLLVRNAQLIDGTGAPPRRGVSILVRDGCISAIGPGIEADGVPSLEAEHTSVIPGLIDAHVHLGVTPGSTQRCDAPDVARALRHAHLRAYLACGVTTVLDTNIDPEAAREIQQWLATGRAGPRFLTLGPGFVTPGGYLSEGQASTSSLAEVEAQFRILDDLGVVGVKVFIERGFGPWPVWPVPAPEVREAIMREAALRALPIYVHANREEDKMLGLDMGAHAITHAGFSQGAPTDEFVARMRKTSTYLMTTLVGMRPLPNAQWFDDPAVRRSVPRRELQTALDPEAGRTFAAALIGMAVPKLPRLLRRPVARVALRDSITRRSLANAQSAVRTLWAAGIPIVIASDSGNWSIDPFRFHGPTTLREIDLVGAAGLPVSDVIASTTRIPARMLGLEAEIGTIEVGKRADLIVVGHDPLRGLQSLSDVRWVVKDGVPNTPAGWLANQ